MNYAEYEIQMRRLALEERQATIREWELRNEGIDKCLAGTWPDCNVKGCGQPCRPPLKDHHVPVPERPPVNGADGPRELTETEERLYGYEGNRSGSWG